MTTPRFVWDEDKEADNVRKHGVDFQQAIEVLLDPLARSEEDVEHSAGEERWSTTGTSRAGQVLHVTTSEDASTIRIISARAATRRDDMPTKKPKPPKPVQPRVERGRYARLSSDGYVVEVTPSPKSKDVTPDRQRPRPAGSQE